MDYKIEKQIKDSPCLRSSFMELSEQIFGISFYDWYKHGFWTDNYIPYSVVSRNKIIANASVNIMDFDLMGESKRYIQIGTVMTAPEYRNKGLSRALLNEIISDWKDKCSCLYLFANASVTDFYPKFGFRRAYEYQFDFKAEKNNLCFEKLDITKKKDLNTIAVCYEYGNPYSALHCKNSFGLIMFWLGSFLKNCIYYSRAYDTVLIAEIDKDRLFCYDIWGKGGKSPEFFISGVTAHDTKRVFLGFTPSKPGNGQFNKISNSDDALFILNGSENIFDKNKMMFPLLSHA